MLLGEGAPKPALNLLLTRKLRSCKGCDHDREVTGSRHSSQKTMRETISATIQCQWLSHKQCGNPNSFQQQVQQAQDFNNF